MKRNSKKAFRRFIIRYGYVLRFIGMTLFAVVVVLSAVFGIRALLRELSIPNRPVVVPLFGEVQQEGTIEKGRPAYGDKSFIPIVLRNIGRKPALDLKWSFKIRGESEFSGEDEGPFSRRDSIAVMVVQPANPVEAWDYKILKYSIEYGDKRGTRYFQTDSILLQPLIGNDDRRKMGGLPIAPGDLPKKGK